MAKLLISVRDYHEAVTALSAGADIIDVKEPTRGSLGAADDKTVHTVIAHVDDQCPVSMACGELSQVSGRGAALQKIPVSYAKIGMSGYRNRPDWLAAWSNWSRSLSVNTQPIAVVYADSLIANAPPALEIIAGAPIIGCVGVLIDTFNKQKSRSLLDCCDSAEIVEMIRNAREQSLFVAVAGSLNLTSIPKVLRWAPDVIAVRGAACCGNRLGRIDGGKVRDLVAALVDQKLPRRIRSASERMQIECRKAGEKSNTRSN